MASKKWLVLTTVTALGASALAGCSGAGGGGGGGTSGAGGAVNVLMVNNPQMVDLQKLTADNFTKATGIKVNYTVLPENDVRDKISQEFSAQAGQYDVASLSNFEIPIYAKNGWVADLTDKAKGDSAFNQGDIMKSMADSLSYEGKVDKPTWDQIADFAAKLDDGTTKGICLRGMPGWGQIFAPLTTVVNTFGGTWFNEDWTPGVNAPEFKAAVNFYVDLVKAHGEAGAPQAGFTECLNNTMQGKTAMWYDATSAAGSLESADSPNKGKFGYVAAPVNKTASSGWLYTWAWAIQKASKNQDNAWKFIAWASSKEYEELVGKQLGWSRVPAGKRASTYTNADYLKEAGAFAEATKAAIEAADPNNAGVQKRPAPGIQFIDIPEFPDLGTKVSQLVSSAIAGQMTVDAALDQGQTLAEAVAAKYKK
ncbi:MAG: extracellular solute-binding protein [Tetrasphaera sp.]|nr:extracellular solute-binding protein [Tetrasphaera sp.]